MANKAQDIEVKKPSASEQQAPERQGLMPFEDMDRWFNQFFNRDWMRPFGESWPFGGDWSPFAHDWPMPRQWSAMHSMPAAFDLWKPRIDLIERDNAFLIKAELPGVKKDDIEVSVNDDRSVTLRAKTSHEEEHKDDHYYQREMSRGSLSRSLQLPSAVITDKVKASFKDGVLELALPKVTPSKHKRVKVD